MFGRLVSSGLLIAVALVAQGPHVIERVQAQEVYPRAAERQAMLQNVEALKTPHQPTVVSDLAARPAAEREFLQFFLEKIEPQFARMSQMSTENGLLSVAYDRALYDNEAEGEAWLKRTEDLDNNLNALSVTAAWKADIQTWGKMAQRLVSTRPDLQDALENPPRTYFRGDETQGSLVDLALRMAESDRVKGFSEAETPLLERLTALTNETTKVANGSLVTPEDQKEAERVGLATETAYRRGEITFQEATERLRTVRSKTLHAKGQDVVNRGSAQFDEIAVIRTELARRKGFQTWADFQSALNHYNHAPGYQSTDDHIAFLRKVLEDTKPAFTQYIEWIKSKNPHIASEITSLNSGLLSPETRTLVAEYFPVERADEFWRSTMLASGFRMEELNQILLDSYPRANKQSHAYMAAIIESEPVQSEVVPGTLNLKVPAAGANTWRPAGIYIVQNGRVDGVDFYETVFHEGGHALDYVNRRVVTEPRPSNAYTETHSMTMERFFQDIDFLVATGRARDGRRLPREIAEQYVANALLMDAIGSRRQMMLALYDFLIWKEAYNENDSEGFTARAQRIYKELGDQYFPGVTHDLLPGFTLGSAMFSTDHFTSGLVRYYGYIYADIAAQQIADYLWRTLRLSTGRGTFLHQRTLATILRRIYDRGSTKPFPNAIEELTSRKFSAQGAAGKINDCVTALTK
jgi:hypothetical protein